MNIVITYRPTCALFSSFKKEVTSPSHIWKIRESKYQTIRTSVMILYSCASELKGSIYELASSLIALYLISIKLRLSAPVPWIRVPRRLCAKNVSL
jgi:hypothetical protein